MRRGQIEEEDCEGLGGKVWQRGRYRKEAEDRHSWRAERGKNGLWRRIKAENPRQTNQLKP